MRASMVVEPRVLGEHALEVALAEDEQPVGELGAGREHEPLGVELEDAEDGTLVAIHARGTPARFFGVAAPLLKAEVRRRIAADLRRLRDCLED